MMGSHSIFKNIYIGEIEKKKINDYNPLFAYPQRLARENEYNIFAEEVFKGLFTNYSAD